ncbi:hypothetical protein EJB05_55507, partial [Eragrostis curvula]
MVARQGRNTRSGNRNARSAAAASGGPKKNLGWMGSILLYSTSKQPSRLCSGPRPTYGGPSIAAYRHGRAASDGPVGVGTSELRLKFKRQRLWIGTFATPEQAALAYDAATYCIYGNDIPRTRRFNFPYMPRPNISEEARAAGIPDANIRAIAEKHARTLAVYVQPVPPAAARAACGCTCAPPLMIDTAAAPGPCAGAVAPVADPGNMDHVSIEEFLNSLSLRS